MTSFNKTNVIVSGSRSAMGEYANYTTVFPKPTLVNGNVVLTQSMISKPNTKYVIKWNFDLNGASITIPQDCLIEFDGGSISNGTLVGQSTILIYNQPLNDILTATLEGTWRHESGVKADEEDITDLNGELKLKDKAYIPANYSGLGRKILRKNIVNGVNILTQNMINEANTIYIIQYDFTLGEDITIPENCILEFDGGSISGEQTIASDGNTIIDGYGLKAILDNNTAHNFLFKQPTWVNGTASGINADGSKKKPYKSLIEAEKHSNWLALVKDTIYTPGCDNSFGIPLVLHHDLTLECPDGIATISGLVTIQGTSTVSGGVNTVNISGVTDKNGNYFPYSDDRKTTFDFGYISDGYSANYRFKVKDINSIVESSWADANNDGTAFSLPIIAIGEPSWYSKEASIGLSCISTGSFRLNIKNIIIEDFGKHGIQGSSLLINAINCSFRNIGGSYLIISNRAPYGNAIEIYTTTEQPCTLKALNCSFENIFDAGLTIQGTGNSVNTFEIYNCIFNMCTYGIEYFIATNDMQNPTNGNMRGCIRNNTFINCNQNNTRWGRKGFAVGGSEQKTQCAIELWNNSESNICVNDNLFIDSPIYGTKSGNTLPQTINNRLLYSYSDAVVLTPYYWGFGIILKVEGVNTKTALDIFNTGYNRKNTIVVCPSNNYCGDTETTPVPNTSVTIINDTGSADFITGNGKFYKGIKYTIKVNGTATSFQVKINGSWTNVPDAPLPFNNTSWDFIPTQDYEDFKCYTIANTKISINNKIQCVEPFVGQCYFNTEKGKPLWWNGAQWVDASGITPI